MKAFQGLFAAVVLLAAGGFGCASRHEEGVKSDYRTQWTNVNADTKTTTEAAKAVLASDDLKAVEGSSTNVDGSVTGKKADGTVVKVEIAKKDAGSQVSVTVGTVGDPTLGADYARRIKEKAEAR